MTEEPLTEEPSSEQADDAGEPDQGWSTGDARVDQAVGRLEELEGRDLDEHADVYDTIHGDLADVLDDAGPQS